MRVVAPELKLFLTMGKDKGKHKSQVKGDAAATPAAGTPAQPGTSVNPDPPDPSQNIPGKGPSPDGKGGGGTQPAGTSGISPKSFVEAIKYTFTVLHLNLRTAFNPYQLPTLPQVIDAVEAAFPEDPGLVLQGLQGGGLGIYKVTLSRAITSVEGITVKLKKGDADVDLPLSLPPERRGKGGRRGEGGGGGGGRRDGTLITFLNAAAEENNAIPATDFDTAIATFGELLKPTMAQTYKDKKCLNGNRYCVIAPKDVTALPGSVTVLQKATNTNHVFNIRFRGQSWFCRRCNLNHVGPCPDLKKFHEAKKEREKLAITMKIYADSSFRRAERVGLAADVACMSGGELGQVTNAILQDPKPIRDVIVCAGGNDIRHTNPATDNEFACAIDGGFNKLEQLHKDSTGVMVVTCLPPKPPDDPKLKLLEDRRALYLKLKLC